MPPKGHAILSASSSERWLNCPPSARLCEAYEDKGSDYAAEGTDAHALCEYRLKLALGMSTEDPIEDLSWYNEEMEECAQGYAAYVAELLETAKQTCSDPVVMIEQRVNFTRWVQDGFGTADCILIADGVLNIVDYKHGKGVEVSAVENPQMLLYALGALEIFDVIYDIDTVRMTIYQPRKSNISVYEMDRSDLLEWADTELTLKAKLAFEGQGEFHCGEWCRFCKAKAECRERAEANLALARYDFEAPALLDDSEIVDILGKVDALTTWACGSFFGSKVWHSTDQYRRHIWQCNGKFSNEECCHTPTLDTETIQRLFIQAYNQLMSDRKQTIADCELARKCLTDFATLDAEIERQLEETQVIAEMVKAAVRENASTAQSQEAYLKKYEALTERYEKAAAELNRLQTEHTARTQQDKKIALFIRTFKKLPDTMTDWDDTIWMVMVEKAIIHKDGEITFVFKNGTEINV